MSRTAISRALNQEAASMLFKEYITLLHAPDGTTRPEQKLMYQKRSVLLDTLTGVDINILVPAISDLNAKQPRDISACSEVLFRWHDDNRDQQRLPLNEANAKLLSETV